VGAGYFLVWTLLGVAIYPVGVALAAVEMRQPAVASAVPMAAGVVVLMAGAIQFTTWKAQQLGCCRALPAKTDSALRFGLRLGLHCAYCCASFTAVLLALGVMDLRAMALVTIGITGERVAPGSQRVAHAIGFIFLAAGLVLIARGA
jgi:predicted metal-binding membrane protein